MSYPETIVDPGFTQRKAKSSDFTHSSLGRPFGKDVHIEEHEPDYVFGDLKSKEYKDALQVALDAQRSDRYKHLTESQWKQLCVLILEHSDCFFIEGAIPSTVQGYEFDLELVPGAQPVMAKLPVLSPKEQEKEQYHVDKAMRLGHLKIPTDKQKSNWATRTHVVFKKDDPMGRWICDFRPLNRVTVKRPCVVGDVFNKTRALSSKLYKSGLDAWSGLNQL